MPHPVHDYDYCSCVKPADCWGESGWHFRLSSPRECFDRYPDQDREGSGGACLRGKSREKCAETGGCRYAGLPVAYERCPRWQEARHRRREEERREETRRTAEKIFA